jgi:cupin fold WbuC family metalloprotein
MAAPLDATAQNVFRNSDDCALVGAEWIDRLKSAAGRSPQRRARLCLHRADDDTLHEMIIALCNDCLFQPHRHPNKSESFHMIDGRLAVVIFDDVGNPVRSLLLTPPGQGGLICYRLCMPAFHAVLPLDDVVVFHEITNGPFRRGDAVVAEWAPNEPEGLREFLRAAAVEAGLPHDLAQRIRVPSITARV